MPLPVLAGHQRLSQHGLSKMPLLMIEGERRLAKTVLLSVAAGDRGRAKLGQNFALRGALRPASSRADEIGAVGTNFMDPLWARSLEQLVHR
jgi:hypothetical protein